MPYFIERLFFIAQNEVEEPTEAPDTFQYRTGKLNQFKGFYTPRPFIPSNMDFCNNL